MGSYMDVHTGDCVDVCRAVRKAVYGAVRGAVRRAVRRDDCTAINYIGGYTADCRTFLVY
jgi:hypothetical protein